VSQSSRFGSRRPDAAFRIPEGETLASFEVYPDAQELIHTLVAHGVPPRSLSILGSDVTMVERVSGKIGYGRAALSAAMSGSWLGLLGGITFVILSPDDLVTPILAGLLIGAGLGMVTGMVLFSLGRGPKRRYRSTQQVIAKTYRVVVDPGQSEAAHTAMREHEAHGDD